MKNFYIQIRVIVVFFILLFTLLTATAQNNFMMSYQAVIRNNNNQLVVNTVIRIRLSIVQGSVLGPSIYQEEQVLTTNENGLISLKIGNLPSYQTIEWAEGPFFLKTEVDPLGGYIFSIVGFSELLSVPYALYSKYTENGFSGYFSDLLDVPEFFDGTWNSLTGKPTTVAGFGITNAMTTSHAANAITGTNITNWNSAYTWGDHAGLYRPIGYVPSWSEITSSPFSITSPANNQLLKFNSVTGKWENWTPNYLTSYSETDPTWTAASSNYYTKFNLQTGGQSAVHWNNVTNRATTLAGYGITNAMATTHAANSITASNITNWNAAYAWGDHDGLYRPVTYVPSWAEVTDKPAFSTVASSGDYNDLLNRPTFDGSWVSITGKPSFALVATSGDYNDLINKPAFDGSWSSITGKPTTVAGFGITNAMTTSHAANAITGANITNWNNAYAWGNHAGLYRPVSYVPAWSEITSNPFSVTSVVNNQLLKYNSTTSKWENWTPNYLTSYSETDPTWTAASTNYYTKTNLQTGGQSSVHWNNVTNRATTLAGYGITNAMATTHAANSITASNITNWNAAYAWGDHDGLYRPVTYVPSWAEVTGKPAFSTVASSGDYNDLLNRPTFDGSWVSITGKPSFALVATSGDYNDLINKPAFDGSWSSITGKPTTVAGFGITNAMTTSHAANAITGANITNWNNAYAWGNHAGLYRPVSYVPAWSEITSNPFSVTSVVNNQLLKYNSTTSKWENWTPNYLTSYSETDPTWTAASTNYYTKTNLQTGGQSSVHWNNVTNRATTLAGYGITNAMATTHAANSITASNITNWNAAYAWGDHDGLYRPVTYVPSWAEVTGKPAFSTVASSGDYNDLLNRPTFDGSWVSITGKPSFALVATSGDYNDLINKPAFDGSWSSITGKPTTVAGFGITNAMTTSHAANAITGANITNWNNAYAWGNHAGLYRPVSYVPAWSEITSNPFSVTSVVNNQLLKYNSTTSKWENWTPNYLTSYSETDPTWTAASTNYYTKTNLQTSGQSQIHFNNLTNKPTSVSGYGITDAMSTSHAANNITVTNITNWNTAFGWGNHSGLYRPISYVPAWSEITSKPTFATVASTGDYNDLLNKPSFNGSWASLTGKPTTLAGYGITDAMSNLHAAFNITMPHINNWNTAYGWGNHAGLYRPMTYVPAWSEITSNPFSIASAANNQLLKYNSSTSKWENWTPNYLTPGNETDPTWTAASTNYYTKTNMQTSGQSQLHFSNLVNKPTNLAGYGITDAMTTGHAANNITGTNISNWNTAYGWGNHSGLYRPISYVPAWSEITSKPTFATVATSGSYNDLSNKPTTDGSETKISAGTNVTITGSGTTASPYVINASGSGGSSGHYVGELYQGGVVFWVDNTGTHGLIVACVDQSAAYSWSNVVTVGVNGNNGLSDWNGSANSTSIMAQSGHTSSAAKLCDNYSNTNYGTGVYSDWYLPSLEELRKLMNNKYEVSKALDSDGNSATTKMAMDFYWSSTEISATMVAIMYFMESTTWTGAKSDPNRVRAIRAF